MSLVSPPSFFFPFALLLLGSFHPVASAVIDQFKLLLTGSAGDLWLHLSLTWNPLPSGLTQSILLSFIGLAGLPLSVLSVLCDMITFSTVCLSIWIFFSWIAVFLMHFSFCVFLYLQNKLRTGG